LYVFVYISQHYAYPLGGSNLVMGVELIAVRKQQEQFYNIIIIHLTECCLYVFVYVSQHYAYPLGGSNLVMGVELIAVRKQQEQFYNIVTIHLTGGYS